MNYSNNFVISKDHLSKSQISMLKNHIDVCESFDINVDYTDSWDIIESDKNVKGNVQYDTLDMNHFLYDIIEIDMDYVHWVEDMTEVEILKDKQTKQKKRIKARKPKLLKIKKHEN